MNATPYLERLRRELESQTGFTLSGRDHATERFLIACSPNGIVEACADGEGIWVEYWRAADETASGPPVTEAWYESPEAAARAIAAWF